MIRNDDCLSLCPLLCSPPPPVLPHAQCLGSWRQSPVPAPSGRSLVTPSVLRKTRPPPQRRRRRPPPQALPVELLRRLQKSRRRRAPLCSLTRSPASVSHLNHLLFDMHGSDKSYLPPLSWPRLFHLSSRHFLSSPLSSLASSLLRPRIRSPAGQAGAEATETVLR